MKLRLWSNASPQRICLWVCSLEGGKTTVTETATETQIEMFWTLIASSEERELPSLLTSWTKSSDISQQPVPLLWVNYNDYWTLADQPVSYSLAGLSGLLWMDFLAKGASGRRQSTIDLRVRAPVGRAAPPTAAQIMNYYTWLTAQPGATASRQRRSPVAIQSAAAAAAVDAAAAHDNVWPTYVLRLFISK